MDAVPGGDGLGRVQRVADMDVGEESVVAVALVLGRVELEADGLTVERVLGEGSRLGAEARLGLGRMDDLGRVDADDPDGLDAGRQLDADGVAVDDLDHGPGKGRRVGASVGVGSEVGDAVGATDGDSDADAVRVGVGTMIAAIPSSLPPATAAAATMIAPATNRPIFLRDIGGEAPDVMAKVK